MRIIYLDHNATTPPLPEVVEAVRQALEIDWANPSSIHRPGQAARARVELAREEVAALLGAQGRDVVFTSGGTEADGLAIAGTLAARPGRRVIATSRIEHAAVRERVEAIEAAGAAEIAWLPIDRAGRVDVAAAAALLEARGAEIALLSVMWANNETGVIQPVPELGAICRAAGVLLHVDAVQAAGKVRIDFGGLPIDLLSVSAHKLNGPKGVGALLVRAGLRLGKQSIGGAQERGRRGGTENVPGIVGFGVAARAAAERLADPGAAAALAERRDRFERAVRERVPDAIVIGAEAPRVPNTASLAFPRLEAEALLLLLSERGVCAAAGAACASGSLEPSPVLLAMGVPAEAAHGAVRFSLGPATTVEELDVAAGIVAESVAVLRRSTIPAPR